MSIFEKKEAFLFDNQYLPTINWFKNVVNLSDIYLNVFDDYQKSLFLNRTVLSGSSGPVCLSIPVEGGRNQKKKYKDVKVSYSEKWQHRHWRTIVSCYGKTPFFEFYQDGLFSIYNKKVEFLFDFNFMLLEKLFYYIFDNQISISFVYQKVDDFYRVNSWQNVAHISTISYYQNFIEKNDFKHNMSIVDLLFMEGNNTKNILKL